MLVRPPCVAVLLLVFAATLSAEEKVATPKVGDNVVVEMTGEFAKEYGIRAGMDKRTVLNAKGLSIETTATVEQRLADGGYRIEHRAPIENGKGKPRMVTLTAIVEPEQIKSAITPANTAIYASPDDAKKGGKPFVTKKDETSLRIELSTFREAKLRTWEMIDEAGK